MTSTMIAHDSARRAGGMSESCEDLSWRIHHTAEEFGGWASQVATRMVDGLVARGVSAARAEEVAAMASREMKTASTAMIEAAQALQAVADAFEHVQDEVGGGSGGRTLLTGVR